MRKRHIRPYAIILGATGSVGSQAVSLLEGFDGIRIIAMSCKKNGKKLQDMAKRCGCDFLHVEKKNPGKLKNFLENAIEKYPKDQLSALNAISGFAGLEASFILAELGIQTLLANKESVVAGGKTYIRYARRNSVEIVPVDSEHSCLSSLIGAFGRKNIRKIILTCSGGPFRDRSDLSGITPEEAVKNPNWRMGPKISVDSSTLANKVAEMIEAKHLFDLHPDQIEAVVQKNSHVHSLIQLKSGSYAAEISRPGMSLPIARAFGLDSFPIAEDVGWDGLRLEFSKPDEKKFPFLLLAKTLLDNHGKCVAFNAADEEAVRLFLEKRIAFTDIFNIVERTVRDYSGKRNLKTLDEIREADRTSREAALSYAKTLEKAFFQDREKIE